MSNDNYSEQQERARLMAAVSAARARLAQARARNEALRIDLFASQAAARDSIHLGKALAVSFLPVLDDLNAAVHEAETITTGVKNAIFDLASKYVRVKHISTATKNLTQLHNEYTRKFGLYSHFRRVCLGYVVGMDKVIIDSDTVRASIEKNYLANSEYWVAHCIMATMGFLHDEKDLAYRALNESLKINNAKSTVFYLLFNLRFARNSAAKLWYKEYNNNLDINDIGDEWQYLLQAYLYKVFGNDEEFEKEVNEQYKKWVDEIKKYTINSDDKINNYVINFADSFPYATNKDYELLTKHCKNYDVLLKQLSSAEKNLAIAKYYREILETEPKLKESLSKRIEDILHQLINSYDADENEILKLVKYNEYIIQTRGDIVEAQKKYQLDLANEKSKTLLDMILKFAFSSPNDKIDILVRRFAISFIIDNIKIGYLNYQKKYSKEMLQKPTFEIDGCIFSGNEQTKDESRNIINKFYDVKKPYYINKNKKYKGFKISTIVFSICLGLSMLWMILDSVLNKDFTPSIFALILFVAGIIGLGISIPFMIVQKKKSLKELKEKKLESLKTLDNLMDELEEYHKDYQDANMQMDLLQETIEKFRK